jgi:DNA-binding PadR family transcriptional regulator
MNKFKGFEGSKQNWSKLPHQLIEALPAIKTIGELKVIIYTLRHTWGYQDDYKKITLDEFENGRKRKDGSRIDNGTGLTKPTIVDGIKRAVADGFLFEHVDLSDTARVKKFYSLTQEGLKDLTPGVKIFNTRGKDFLHRTEKETVKKETLENGSAQNSDILSPDDLSDQIAILCQLGSTISDGKVKEVKDATIKLHPQNITIQDLNDFKPWWYDNTWKGQRNQHPEPTDICNEWGRFEAAKVINVPITTDGGFYV